MGSKVMSNFSHKLRAFLGGGAPKDGDWRQLLTQVNEKDFADQLFKHLGDQDENDPWLFLVDELPIFIKNLYEAEGAQAISQFLYWLRGIRLKYPRIQWLYAGSIGLDSIAREHSVEGALNDLKPYTLKPFDRDTAADFITDVAKRRNCTISGQSITLILDRLGWLSPFYLENIVDEAYVLMTDSNEIDEESTLEAIESLLGTDKRLYWSSWREHLDKVFKEPKLNRLYTILKTVAKSHPSGAERDSLLLAINHASEPVEETDLKNLLDILMHDGYLRQDENNRYHFRMDLLREWWLRYVV